MAGRLECGRGNDSTARQIPKTSSGSAGWRGSLNGPPANPAALVPLAQLARQSVRPPPASPSSATAHATQLFGDDPDCRISYPRNLLSRPAPGPSAIANPKPLSEEDLTRFLEAVRQDFSLKEKIEAEGVDPVAIAMEAGFSITQAELIRYQAGRVQALKGEDLEDAAGGTSISIFPIGIPVEGNPAPERSPASKVSFRSPSGPLGGRHGGWQVGGWSWRTCSCPLQGLDEPKR